MAFTIPNGVTDVIKALSNFPNRIDRLKATQLKAMFDQAAKNVQADVKRLVSELGASTAAGNIGFARSTEVQADNVQDAIENVQEQIVGISQGAVANGSVTSEKLADNSVTVGKIAPRAIQFVDVSDQYTFTYSPDTTGEEVIEKEFRFLPALGIVAFNLSIHLETQGSAVRIFICAGPYTPRRVKVPSQAAYTSLTGNRDLGNPATVVNASICGVDNLSGWHGGDNYLRIMLYSSGAIGTVVAVSGWYFAREAEEAENA